MKGFDQHRAQVYDEQIQQLVPGYDMLHLATAAQLKARLPEEAHILVVGAGTGGEILELAKLCPRWRFMATDISADMLAIAQRRFTAARVGHRVRLHTGDLSSLAQPAQYDAALALLVMHFIPADDQKLAFLHTIAERLSPGAPLLLADLLQPADAAERAAQAHASRMLGLSEEGVAAMLKRLDTVLAPLDERRQAELLSAAGFSAPVRYFQVLGFQSVIATRI